MNYDVELLIGYLMIRAKRENVEFNLTEDFFIDTFEKGCRCFFGVNVNELCFPLYDEQEPEPGFLNNFICYYFISQ